MGAIKMDRVKKKSGWIGGRLKVVICLFGEYPLWLVSHCCSCRVEEYFKSMSTRPLAPLTDSPCLKFNARHETIDENI